MRKFLTRKSVKYSCHYRSNFTFLISVSSFRQCNNGHGSTQIGASLTSAMCAKGSNCSSVVGSVGCHILVWTKFGFTMASTQSWTIVPGLVSIDFMRALEMLISLCYEMTSSWCTFLVVINRRYMSNRGMLTSLVLGWLHIGNIIISLPLPSLFLVITFELLWSAPSYLSEISGRRKCLLKLGLQGKGLANEGPVKL